TRSAISSLGVPPMALASPWLGRWCDWRHVLAVVQLATFLRWHRERFRLFWHWLRDEFALDVPYTMLHGMVRYQLKAKLKRPRPSHAKKTSRRQRILSNSARAAWAPSPP